MDRSLSSDRTHRPFFVVLMGLGSVAMFGPALHGFWIGDSSTGRIFLYHGIVLCLLTAFVDLATANWMRSLTRGYLLSLIAAFTILPIMLALPLAEAAPKLSFLDAWFESVSSLTTTGATLVDTPRNLRPSLHLWRAMMGWGGGLLIWIAAIALLAPINIGGFEIRANRGQGASRRAHAQIGHEPDPSDRLKRYTAQFAPLYTALTGALFLGLMAAGDTAYVAVCHAMSIMSTSGISPVGGLIFASSGLLGEMIIFIFFVFALSRLTFSWGASGQSTGPLYRDPELRLGIGLILTLVILLMVRHGVVALESDPFDAIRQGARAFWGALFTLTSFLTTTGFESTYWTATNKWSGLGTPGLMLVGISVIGGGVATTAGGIKLLRVFALYKHSEREVERLIYPSSVGGAGADARQIRRQGAQIAWIFFMLFGMSIALVLILLALTGVQFESALVLSVATLTNTGPLAAIGAETPISYAGLPDAAKVILAFAMAAGRLEALALIALFNPEFWRK